MATINKNDFIRILRTFADSPNDVIADRASVACTINGDDISIALEERDGVLMCKEDEGRLQRASAWIERRLAHLDVLAKKILDVVPYDKHFVDVGAIHESVTESLHREDSLTKAIVDKVKSGSSFSTDVIYIRSEAGDGKSAVMNRVAYFIAKEYKETGSGPLFLPISLDGRPFLRIDDLVIGFLANHFRFRYCYFESILELVKMGALVLGLDGFEEMVVEGKEERVISSLGELLRSFDSRGRIIISARRAFYEYALKDQIPLLDSIRETDVDCGSYSLSSWGGQEFITLLNTYPRLHDNASKIYDALLSRLGKGHPILTRPVLARHLVDVLDGELREDHKWQNVVADLTISRDPQAVMTEFVNLLISREANYKWLVTSGPTQGRPVLSLKEHMAILKAFAEEMWLSSVEFVKQDYLQDWIELICSELQKNPIETRDAKEKILHHAMLVRDGDKYGFCHEAFRKFCLGQDVADYIIQRSEDYRLERILSHDTMDYSIVDQIVYAVSQAGMAFEEVSKILVKVKGGVSKLSPVGQNVGSIVLGYTKLVAAINAVAISDLFFSAAAVKGANVQNLDFIGCTFENLDFSKLNGTNNFRINHCTILTMAILDLSPNGFENSEISADSLPKSLTIGSEESKHTVYDPQTIERCLIRVGLLKRLQGDDKSISYQECPRDERMSILNSLAIVLQRTSGLSDKALEVRFGKKWHNVKEIFIPLFLDDGILKKRVWHGSGGSERYSLNVPVGKFELARQSSDGTYDAFLIAIRKL